MNMPVLLTNLIMVPLIINLIEEIYFMLFFMIFSLLQKAIYMLVISPSSNFSGWNRI